jgi:hypothetical protein
MVPLLPILMLSAWLAPADRSFAQPLDDLARSLARCVDDSAVAVAHVDLGQVDVAAAVKQLTELSQHGVAVVGPSGLKSLATSAQALQAAGVHHLYAVFMPTPLGDRNPYYVALVEPGRDAAVVVQQIKTKATNPTGLFVVSTNEDSFASVAAFGNAIVAANRDIVDRLQRSAPMPRSELQAAMVAAGSAPVSLLLIPSADQRKAIEETLPELPQAVGGGAVTRFTRGLIWAAVTYSPERGTCELTIQSQDVAAAEALRQTLRDLPGKITVVPLLKTVFPDGRLPAVLVPAVQNNMLKLTVRRSDPGAAALETAFADAGKVVRSTLWNTTRRDYLKLIALSMHTYHDVHQRFPAQANYDKNGRPLLSWRVHILPFLEEGKLYKEFHLDESWDSEHNKKLIERIPSVYRSPELTFQDFGKTTLLGGAGKNSLFQGKEGVSIRQITDGTSLTFMIVEAPPNAAVVWTKPEDFDVDAHRLHERLFRGRDSFGAAICDGSARVIGKDIAEKTLRALFSINGGEVIPSGF